jgi:hypothetical protein
MDSQPSTSPPNRTNAFRTRIIIAAISLVVVIVAIIASNNPAPGPKFLWLDQSQFASQMQPGRLKTLYFKIVHITSPVWQRFRKPKTQILISSEFLAVHGLFTGDLGIGPAMATNETSARVWILSPSELDDLRHRLKTANDIDVVNAPRIVTSDGSPASIRITWPGPPKGSHANVVIPIGPLAGGNPFVGVTLDVNPKIVSRELQLAVSAVYSEPNEDSFMDPIRTNISAACRVRLSNAGGVLISSPVSHDLNGTNYWLILSPTAIDRYAKPIKL